MGMTVRDLERVIYFDSYIVVNQGHSPYIQKTLLSAQEYDDYLKANEGDIIFKAEMGAEAIRLLLAAMDLNFEVRKLQEEFKQTTSIAARHRIAKRYKVVHGLVLANIRPEWAIF
jgi:DNA-directed RNA polymerase subunit beta'